MKPKRIAARFEKYGPKKKYEYAQIKFKVPEGFAPYDMYNHGPSMWIVDGTVIVDVRKPLDTDGDEA